MDSSWAGMQAIALLGCFIYFFAVCFAHLPGRMSVAYTDMFVDDTFIFFRYAEHLASGLGFVWNPGEPPVEGISSIAWVAVLAFGQRLTGLPIPTFALWAGVAFACLAVVFVWITTLRLLKPANRKFAILAPIVLATTPWIARHACSGMETTMVMCAYAMLFAVLAKAEAPTARGAALVGVLSALFYLVRPDSTLIAFVVPFCVYAVSGAHGVSFKAARDPQVRRRLLGYVLAFFLALIVLTAIRSWYFRSFFPPPAYLKLGITRPDLGNLARFIAQQWAQFPAYAGYLLLPIAWGLIAKATRRPLEIGLLVGVAAFAAYQLQVVPVVNFELRFFTPTWTLLSILATIACVRLGNRLTAEPRATGLACSAFVAVQLLVSIGNLHASRPAKDWHFRLQSVAEALRDVGPITIAYSEAGVVPFYSKQRFLDYAGLTDLTIARNRYGTTALLRNYWPYVRSRYGLPDVHFAPFEEYEPYAGFGNVPDIAAQYELHVACGTQLWVLIASPHSTSIRNALKQASCG